MSGFLARWSRWWPVRPDSMLRSARCCDCRFVTSGTGERFAELGWHDDHAGSYLCPSCSSYWREQAA